MQLTGKIESIGSQSSGISQYTGEPWKACSLVLRCTESVAGNEIKNSFLLRCRDSVCDKVQEIAKTADVAGNIEGTFKCTCFSRVSLIRSKQGNEYEKQEITLTQIERIDV